MAYRGLNKLISNEGCKIPNMRDMLMRIEHQRDPNVLRLQISRLDYSDATTRNESQIYRIHIIPRNIRVDACSYGFTSVR